MTMLRTDDPLAIAVTTAIRNGDVLLLKRLLDDNPELATSRIGKEGMGRSLPHIAADWPGHFPNGREVVHTLIEAGADVNAPGDEPHPETPLHWAASSDDVEVLDALLDAGADIEAPGAVIGGGTPLADATGFGQWRAARRLVERGARVTLPQAAALGLMPKVEEYFAGAAPPMSDEITNAFWYACNGGQRLTAEYLLHRGADLNWIGYDEHTPLDIAESNEDADLILWLRDRGAKAARDLS
jgi:ankyrin repeat protein